MDRSPKRIPRALPALLFFVSALQVTDNQLVPFLLASFEADAWPGHDPAHLVSGYAVGSALFTLAVTWLFPTAAPRRLLLAALGTLSLTVFAFGRLPGFETALVLRALAGGASAILSLSQLTLAVATGGGAAVAAMTAGFVFALVAGAPLAAIAVARFGIETTYRGVAIAGATLFLSALALAPRVAATAKGSSAGFLRYLVSRPHRNGLLASLVVAVGVVGPTVLLPRALQDPTGAALGLADVGRIYLIAGLGPLLALPLAPRALREFGARAIAARGAFLLVPPILLVGVLARFPTPATVALIAALLVETIRRAGMQTHLAAIATYEDRARYLGLRSVLVQIGLAGGTEFAEILRRLHGFAAACAVGALLVALSAFLVPPPPPPHGFPTSHDG